MGFSFCALDLRGDKCPPLRTIAFYCLLCVIFCDIVSCNYLNQYAVHIRGGRSVADAVARKHGFINGGQIGELEDYYLFHHHGIKKRSANPSHEHHSLLSKEPEVRWVEQQVSQKRVKRDFRVRTLTDRLWRDQWYLNGGGHRGDTGHYDMSVKGAWDMGYTGRNIVVTILDDGIERNHNDLIDNYDPYASTDINSHDSDPMPRYDPTNENRHGTRCAGEVAAKANNTKCIIGAAFNARIGGVRMLDGDVSDAVEAASLSFNKSHIDIYSASWGPDDDGRVVDGPGRLARQAFLDGIEKGRGNKGNIFVWASGNGGSAFDSCNCDGYTNSIYTLSISSTSEHGRKPWYLEECASTLATTYSSGAYNEKQIVSTDLHNQCTTSHTGTSASAPLAAGLVALVLEANPQLTWRDVQYITMLSANPEPMVDGNWITNGMGRKVSLRYGYGLMNATAMVERAIKWVNVPPKHICSTVSSVHNFKLMGTPFSNEVHTNGCYDTDNEINHLEHVQAQVTLSYYRRGNLIIHLTSPSGTRSTLLPKRPSDMSHGGFNQWAFLSVQFWGEDPRGTWKLEIEDEHPSTSWPRPPAGEKGTLTSWSLILHGTKTDPLQPHRSTTPHHWTRPFSRTHYTRPWTTPIRSITTLTVNCHKECVDGCSGPLPENCHACKHYRIGDDGKCVAQCPESYRLYKEKCLPCEASCENCTTHFGYKAYCEKCKDGYFMLDGEGECSLQCPEGYFQESPGHKVCKKCDRQCEMCSESSGKCTRCPSGLILKDHNCFMPVKICNKGYYSDGRGKCEHCDVGCDNCNGPNRCNFCEPIRFRFGGKCYTHCPGGHLPYIVQMDIGTGQNECRLSALPPTMTVGPAIHDVSPVTALTHTSVPAAHIHSCSMKPFTHVFHVAIKDRMRLIAAIVIQIKFGCVSLYKILSKPGFISLCVCITAHTSTKTETKGVLSSVNIITIVFVVIILNAIIIVVFAIICMKRQKPILHLPTVSFMATQHKYQPVRTDDYS
ncbi:hypothetical protein FSP39_010877 [Pinctada imbricata]|uniref:P/Homo B domain-containing protein n=1 Tax=Pinctada imbricata TaxID=66713 RepID=A0AA88YIG7_PINIB|nr:hypothetical protein FSP39_010877 [Pinctada imbricata]